MEEVVMAVEAGVDKGFFLHIYGAEWENGH